MRLTELTMRAGDLSYNLSRYFTMAIKKISEFSHVGDIEDDFKVLNLDSEFLIIENTDEKPIAYFYVKDVNQDIEILIAYVESTFRNKNVFTKFIWFLKRFYNTHSIYLSDVHSKDTIEVVKKLSLRFNVFWEKDGHKEKYDPENLDSYYSYDHPTGWKIVLENSGDFSNWPKFFNESIPDVKQFYDWLLEE
jgi:hypothetical protein